MNKNDFQAYYQNLINQKTPSSSLKRYLSSLRQFGRFLAASGETSADPAAGLILPAQFCSQKKYFDIDKLCCEYGSYLKQEGLAETTIINYLADTRQFLTWLKIRY